MPSLKGLKTWDHPRGCGEHFPSGTSRIRVRGSSCGCGEHDPPIHGGDGAKGSSPRMRGARLEWIEQKNIFRIIPADAGSTHEFFCCGVWREDHPRGCGEHQCCYVSCMTILGSSPRMRGALCRRSYGILPHRIIPADAGSTIANVLKKNDIRDHPRGCGEHCICRRAESALMGSSPRMRGARPIASLMRANQRIIPADAGSTTYYDRRRATNEDHPRGCGEHRSRAPVCSAIRGSSPRMRGARQHVHARVSLHGIIPADAGSTLPSSCLR